MALLVICARVGMSAVRFGFASQLTAGWFRLPW